MASRAARAKILLDVAAHAEVDLYTFGDELCVRFCPGQEALVADLMQHRDVLFEAVRELENMAAIDSEHRL